MILLLLALSACGSKTASEDELALQMRNQYLDMQSCEGIVEMVSDYGQRVYNYTASFSWKKDGDMVLTLEKPDELAGVTARIAQGKTMLEFEGARLETGPVSSEGMSPIDSLPVTLDYMMKGYIAECGWEPLEEKECLRIQFRNPEQAAGEGAEAILWLDKETGDLVKSEMISNGVTVVRCQFTAFTKG
jgi:outer membrane lipoprotein-sorting protein